MIGAVSPLSIDSSKRVVSAEVIFELPDRVGAALPITVAVVPEARVHELTAEHAQRHVSRATPPGPGSVPPSA